ncbi:hypothetical protein BS50DRAFT_78626 [Corynespora cassiicola Philippines]|uniref:Uncharacterized protein n=1 Tax=Corynespora cassiicola Philippines TaxID=1448308 RepID=A0A2T2NGS0_CORCC|nr:hypothetical protein BS50DRAFT_78626 [Corynespora cassiicola Philippines]
MSIVESGAPSSALVALEDRSGRSSCTRSRCVERRSEFSTTAVLFSTLTRPKSLQSLTTQSHTIPALSSSSSKSSSIYLPYALCPMPVFWLCFQVRLSEYDARSQSYGKPALGSTQGLGQLCRNVRLYPRASRPPSHGAMQHKLCKRAARAHKHAEQVTYGQQWATYIIQGPPIRPVCCPESVRHRNILEA